MCWECEHNSVKTDFFADNDFVVRTAESDTSCSESAGDNRNEASKEVFEIVVTNSSNSVDKVENYKKLDVNGSGTETVADVSVSNLVSGGKASVLNSKTLENVSVSNINTGEIESASKSNDIVTIVDNLAVTYNPLETNLSECEDEVSIGSDMDCGESVSGDLKKKPFRRKVLIKGPTESVLLKCTQERIAKKKKSRVNLITLFSDMIQVFHQESGFSLMEFNNVFY
ncbi:hypothetical protein LOTGIDRAFT_161760 [Lottia gigantea]|uniref:Uncharacterized protein n=1 Tax=Lottia gigantea TaxID=225164 RepID=V4A8X2_LOTGI|nr:hypothetical protein LOTGIDRAFT_161760 [Lottia gigantea]ESO93207.1 hypothetical protein LOTGIDRAFT_161760 [Lottia gigantea]